MAGSRQSKAFHRRQQQAREHAVQQRITLAAIGVLLAVAILVGVGVVLTVILPPRAHVLSVGNRNFTAKDVAARAEFGVLGRDRAMLNSPATAAIDAITRDETLLQAGASMVDPVTDDDLNKAIRTHIGVAADAPKEQYATAYQSFLRGIPLSQADYERSVRAQIVGDRLLEHFRSAVPAAGLQFHVQGAQSPDQAQVKALHDAAAGGADFGAKAVELGLAKTAADVERGWALPDDFGAIKDAVTALPAGQVTDVIPISSGMAFAVYRVAERDEQRTYDDAQRGRLASQQLDDWVKQQRDPLHVREDLSSGEQAWIVKRVQNAAQKAAQKATPSAVPPAPQGATPTLQIATPSATPSGTPSATPSGTPGAGG